VFFAIAQIAGAIGPLLYGALIGNGSSNTGLFIGYLIGAVIMILGGVVEILFGVNAEGQALESVAEPLSAVADRSQPHHHELRGHLQQASGKVRER